MVDLLCLLPAAYGFRHLYLNSPGFPLSQMRVLLHLVITSVEDVSHF